MRFFIDSAQVDQIKELNDTGLVNGVTTNPSLIAKSGRKFTEVIAEICNIVNGPVSAEVAALDTSGMVNEGKYLSKIAHNVVVKIPLTIEGLKACKILSDDNIKVNVTLCFSAAQALLAAKAGAAYISPFIGRLDDIGQNGLALIEEICMIFNQYPSLQTEILVASVRSPHHVVESAKMGAHVATLPPAILKQMFNHPLTDIGLNNFMEDWKKSGQTIIT